MTKPHDTYRGSRPHEKRPRRSLMLKASAKRRGLTRREMDREREAVRRFIMTEEVMSGFTAGQLLGLVTQMATERA
jgi:hypothetical protein